MSESKFLEQEESTHALHEGYRAKVDIVQVVDCVLPAAGVLEDVSGTFGEDPYSNGNDDDDCGPEEGHENRPVTVFEYANEDQVAVER